MQLSCEGWVPCSYCFFKERSKLVNQTEQMIVHPTISCSINLKMRKLLKVFDHYNVIFDAVVDDDERHSVVDESLAMIHW